MQRFLFWLLLLLGIGLSALLYLKFTLPHENSTVFLKSAPNDPIIGYVIEKDKYIVIEKDGAQQLYPWDEIKTISGPKPIHSRTAASGYWLDMLGRHDKLDEGFRTQLMSYARFYGYEGFLSLIGRYNYLHRLLWRNKSAAKE